MSSRNRSNYKVKWSELTVNELNMYTQNTEELLKCVYLNHDLILCDDVHCTYITDLGACNSS